MLNNHFSILAILKCEGKTFQTNHRVLLNHSISMQEKWNWMATTTVQIVLLKYNNNIPEKKKNYNAKNNTSINFINWRHLRNCSAINVPICISTIHTQTDRRTYWWSHGQTRVDKGSEVWNGIYGMDRHLDDNTQWRLQIEYTAWL